MTKEFSLTAYTSTRHPKPGYSSSPRGVSTKSESEICTNNHCRIACSSGELPNLLFPCQPNSMQKRYPRATSLGTWAVDVIPNGGWPLIKKGVIIKERKKERKKKATVDVPVTAAHMRSLKYDGLS